MAHSATAAAGVAPPPRALSTPKERGAGVVGTSAGYLVFLLLLFAAVQILFNLYATTVVTSEAHRAARAVATVRGGTDRCQTAAVAERRFQQALGAYGQAGYASLTWDCSNPELVEVTVVADHPTILPARIGGLANLSHLERTIQVRIERFQP